MRPWSCRSSRARPSLGKENLFLVALLRIDQMLLRGLVLLARHHVLDAQVDALFEIMTLGNFGAFYSCLHDDVKSAICGDLHMPEGNFDPPVTLKRIIFTFKDLRNAVAHNGIVLDVRFKTGSVSKTVGGLLKFEMGIPNADFEEITDYILLITYLMARLEFTKTECRQPLQGYREIIE